MVVYEWVVVVVEVDLMFKCLVVVVDDVFVLFCFYYKVLFGGVEVSVFILLEDLKVNFV